MKDLSGHGNDGTITGTTIVTGKVGLTKHFNAGDRITASAIPVPATDFTVAAWFRWTTNPSPYYTGIQGGRFSWELRVRADGRFAAVFYQSVEIGRASCRNSTVADSGGNLYYSVVLLRHG